MIQGVAGTRSVGRARAVQGAVIETVGHHTIDARKAQVASASRVVTHAVPGAVARAVHGCRAVKSRPPRVAVARRIQAGSAPSAIAWAGHEVAFVR